MPGRVQLALIAAVAVGACAKSSSSAPPPDPTFHAATPAVYVAKVKNLLVGLPATDAELQAVTKNPGALGGLVDGWMKRPEYGQKMIRFFQLAFQQTQIGSNDFLDQIYAQVGLNDSTTPRLLQNVQESFARTMLALTADGHPLTEAMTTRQFMMTTATKELYAFMDTVDIDNDGKIFDRWRQQNRTVGIVLESAQGPIPLTETLDPMSPNFMRWYDPDVATAYADNPACHADPITLTPVALSVHYLFLGTIDSRKLADGTLCPRVHGSAQAPQFTAHDFEDWSLVTVRPADVMAGEEPTHFYDLAALRTAQELVLVVPRIGFFSTPAFFANWPTNVSNQMRATMHQALIVATGHAVDGTDMTYPPGTPGLDQAHSNQGACIGCHKTLDPTRSIFAATWSWHYRRQQDPAFIGQPGMFAFNGVVKPVADIAAFAEALAAHPLVAPGWVQKLCNYFNSAPCDEGDPEFKRLVDQFRSSKYAWNPLVKALVTSPIVTNAASTQTARTNGEVVAVARRDHLCAALEARLQLPDVCGLRSGGNELGPIVSGLPSDAYARGATAPILPNDPTLFFRAGLENICTAVAAKVIDGGGRWSSANPDAAIHDFVGVVMALPPSDPRATEAEALLKDHFAEAKQQPDIGAKEALQSTFVAACLAPSAVSVGL